MIRQILRGCEGKESCDILIVVKYDLIRVRLSLKKKEKESSRKYKYII